MFFFLFFCNANVLGKEENDARYSIEEKDLQEILEKGKDERGINWNKVNYIQEAAEILKEDKGLIKKVSNEDIRVLKEFLFLELYNNNTTIQRYLSGCFPALSLNDIKYLLGNREATPDNILIYLAKGEDSSVLNRLAELEEAVPKKEKNRERMIGPTTLNISFCSGSLELPKVYLNNLKGSCKVSKAYALLSFNRELVKWLVDNKKITGKFQVAELYPLFNTNYSYENAKNLSIEKAFSEKKSYEEIFSLYKSALSSKFNFNKDTKDYIFWLFNFLLEQDQKYYTSSFKILLAPLTYLAKDYPLGGDIKIFELISKENISFRDLNRAILTGNEELILVLKNNLKKRDESKDLSPLVFAKLLKEINEQEFSEDFFINLYDERLEPNRQDIDGNTFWHFLSFEEIKYFKRKAIISNINNNFGYSPYDLIKNENNWSWNKAISIFKSEIVCFKELISNVLSGQIEKKEGILALRLINLKNNKDIYFKTLEFRNMDNKSIEVYLDNKKIAKLNNKNKKDFILIDFNISKEGNNIIFTIKLKDKKIPSYSYEKAEKHTFDLKININTLITQYQFYRD